MTEETRELPEAGGEGELEETELLASTLESEETSVHPLERANLLCIGGPMAGRSFNVNLTETKIGRARDYNHIVLEKDRKASRRHATIVARGGRYVIFDRRSRNRTFVNRHKLKEDEQLALNFGDEIEAGSSIFRFVCHGRWDWSPPRRAGSFLARRGHTVLIIASLVVAAVVGYLGFGAHSYLVSANARPGQLSLSVARAVQVGAAGAEPDMYYHYSPAIAWLPSLRRCGVAAIAVDGDGRLVMFDGSSLEVLWNTQGGAARADQGLAVGDVNDDGVDDIVFSTVDGKVAAVDGETGVFLWRSGFLSLELLSPTIGDIDGDGIEDVVVISAGGTVFLGRNDGTGSPGFRALQSLNSKHAAPASIVDLNGDGNADVVVVDIEGKATVIDGATGRIEIAPVYPADRVQQKTGMSDPPTVLSSPAFARIVGDKERMMVFADNSVGYAVASVGRPDRVTWAKALFAELGFPQVAASPHYPSPVVADLDNGDAQPDVIVGVYSGTLIALDGNSGSVIWKYNGKWELIFATPALYDFDKDGVTDIAFCDNRGGIHLVSGKTGQRLAKGDAGSYPVYASPLVGDVDGDGVVEVVVQNSEGEIRVLKTNSVTPEHKAFWLMEGGTASRVNAEWFEGFDTQSKLLIIAIAGGIILILLILNLIVMFVRMNRRRRLEKLGAH